MGGFVHGLLDRLDLRRGPGEAFAGGVEALNLVGDAGAFLLDVFRRIGGVINQKGDQPDDGGQPDAGHRANKRHRRVGILGEINYDERREQQAEVDHQKNPLGQTGGGVEVHRRVARTLLFAGRGGFLKAKPARSWALSRPAPRGILRTQR